LIILESVRVRIQLIKYYDEHHPILESESVESSDIYFWALLNGLLKN